MVVKPTVGALTAPVPPPKPAKPSSKSRAGGPNAGQRKRRRMEVDRAMMALSSFFLTANELGPDIP